MPPRCRCRRIRSSIDHRACFPTLAARDAFIREVVEQGFTIAGTHDDEDGFAVDFARTDIPEKMNGVSIDLMERAQAHSGDYDGWGCPVV